jgi:type I restriction enzyme S subunit
MNAAQLLAHFDRVTDAPDAIPRLRQFILDLAVRGKLVAQDPRDEPASELLKHIKAERLRLERDAEIKKHEVPPVVEDDEMYEIPANWAWTRLGQIGDWSSGSTPPRGNHEYYGGGITWLKSGELNDNKQLTGSEETVTETAISRCSFRQNRPGDVLIAMYGATIGKLAILSEPAVTNQAVCGCTPFRGLFNRYLFDFLLSQRAQFRSASEGGAQPNISKAKIVGFAFPLPPLAEQCRIVAKVDELMSLCDRLDAARAERESRRDRIAAASLHRLNQPADTSAPDVFCEHARFYLNHLPRLTTRPDQIKQLRQTIVNLAVRGRLVPQDPNEPASVFSERIQAERMGLESGMTVTRTGERRTADCPSEGPPDLPRSWRWAKTETICEAVIDCPHSTPAFVMSGIVCLDTNCFKDGTLIEHKIRYVSEETYRERVQRLVPQGGDVVFAREGSVGASVIVPDSMKCCLGQRVMLFRPTRNVLSTYFSLALSAPSSLARLLALHKGVGAKHVNVQDMRRALVPLPPLAEQRRIVAKVDELMALCDKLEAQLVSSQTESRRLLEAVLHEALARVLVEG